MLFQDLRAGPAARAIELGYDAGAIFALDFVDAVLERAQRQAAAGAADAPPVAATVALG